jgi:hypothetical protein
MKKPEHPLWQPVIATAFCIAAVTSIVEAYRTGTAYGRFSSSDRFRDPTGFNTAILWHGMIALISGIVALASGYELISSWWSH